MKSSTLGKIVGALGLVMVLSAPYTYFITTGQPLFALAKVLIGLAMVAVFFATNYKNLGQFASGRSTFFFTSSAMLAVVLVAALGAVNYVAAKKNKTWDLTRQKIFSLAPQTKSTLGGLKQKVQAIGFLDSKNPAYDVLDDLFRRYHEAAPDKFEYVFKDPKKNPDLAAKYQLKQGQTSVVLVRGEGAGESHTALNVVSEQDLTNALIKLNAVGEQKLYLVQGHGEWPLDPPQVVSTADDANNSLSELKRDLVREGYLPTALSLAGLAEIPKDAAAVVIAGAKQPLLAPEVATLRKYLEQGGRLLYFADASVEPGKDLDKLLSDYGIQVDPGVLADDKFASGSPYQLVSIFYGQHEITRLLSEMKMNTEFPLTRGLSVVREGTLSDVNVTPIVTSSPYAWEELTPDDSPSRSDGEKSGSIPIVLASSRSTASAKDKRFDEARVVVFGDSQILPDVNWGHEANRNLVLNSVAWVSNQVSSITIRPPDRDVSTLDLDRPTLAKIRFVATDLLPLSLLGVGLAIWLSRRNK